MANVVGITRIFRHACWLLDAFFDRCANIAPNILLLLLLLIIIIIIILLRGFGPKTDEVTGEWRKLHNEELHDLYSLPSIVRVIKSRRMRWAGHVAHMRDRRDVYRVLVGKPE